MSEVELYMAYVDVFGCGAVEGWEVAMPKKRSIKNSPYDFVLPAFCAATRFGPC